MNRTLFMLTLSIFLSINGVCSAQIGNRNCTHSQLHINPITDDHIKHVEFLIDSLNAAGVFKMHKSLGNTTDNVKFEFPLSFTPDTANGIYSAYIRTGGGFFDHDQTSGLLDYMGGTHTYDGHKGTDWSLSPFRWHTMDNNLVSVVAAAPGVIVTKIDGNYDRVCSWKDSLREGWNGIIIQHSDGTKAWYIHFKKNSLTSKNVGDYVETGEYLGIVGSSGMSGGPHLHFQVMTANNKAVDPFLGPSNPDITESMWVEQPHYIDKGMNRLLIGSSAPIIQPCPEPEILNEKRNFISGDSITLSFYHRFSLQDDFTCRIRKPDGTIWDEINGTARAVSTWNKKLPNDAPIGVWHYEVESNSTIYSLTFNVGNTYALPEKVVLLSPIDETIIKKSEVKFLWHESKPDVTNYRIELNENDFVWLSDSTLTDTTLILNNFKLGTEFFWRVKAKNSYGWGDWSELWKFSIDDNTSVNENEYYSVKFFFSPNPAEEYVEIIQPSVGFEPSEGSEIRIYNVLGELVMTDSIHPMSKSHRMNVEHLPAGVYFVNIVGCNGACSIIEKFVKL
ncbi:MAG: peptidoglycan DD-metalloendopeptidase family protein [Candidatus Kapabacteria bacterium]|nr:peptidoglycan DD-metalloendopeptidase family protein [Candidatus Kapabacteria bacterium]